MINKLNTKKRVEKSNLSFKLKIKKLEVEVRKAIDNDLSVYEAEIFESRQFSKIQKYLSSIRKNPQVPPIMFWKGMELTTYKQKAESFNFFFASLIKKQKYQQHARNKILISSKLIPQKSKTCSKILISTSLLDQTELEIYC